MQRTASAAAGVLAVCEALADERRYWHRARSYHDPHTGLDRDLFRPLDHAGLRTRLAATFDLPLRENETLLASVGALIERKGQGLVIQALADLPQARLRLVGKGEDEASLRAMAREVGVADRVHFLGSLEPAMPPDPRVADAMVLPSASMSANARRSSPAAPAGHHRRRRYAQW